MKLNSKQLLSILQKLGSVIPNNPVVPITSNILLKSTGTELIFRSTNLQQEITINIDLFCEEGSWVLPYEKLSSLLKMSGDCPIELIFSDNTVTAKMEGKKFKFATEDAKDFPNVRTHATTETIEFDSLEFKEAITIAIAHVSTDDLRPAIRGVYFCNDGICATDMHSLFTYKLKSDLETPFIVPAVFCKSVLGFINEDIISICIGEKSAVATIGDIQISTTLINETYPNYASIIPESSPKEGTIIAEDLNRAIKRAAICSNKTTNMIELNFSESSVSVKSEDVDYDLESNQDVACELNGSLRIGMNGKVISRSLDHVKGEVVIGMSEPNRAIIIKPNGNSLILVMPIILNN